MIFVDLYSTTTTTTATTTVEMQQGGSGYSGEEEFERKMILTMFQKSMEDYGQWFLFAYNN